MRLPRSMSPLTADEIRSLETPYTPRYDFQGISDDAGLQAIMDRIPQLAAAT
jgi:1-deoxyxylulose-5-phosphate synthase